MGKNLYYESQPKINISYKKKQAEIWGKIGTLRLSSISSSSYKQIINIIALN